jgi:hypothetical protein
VADLAAKTLRWLGAAAATLDDPAQIQRIFQHARNRDKGTIPALIELFERGSLADRRESVRLLTEMRARIALPQLVEAAGDEDPEIRLKGIAGAALMGHRLSLERARAVLDADNPVEVKRDVLLALALNGDRTIVAPLSRHLTTSNNKRESHRLAKNRSTLALDKLPLTNGFPVSAPTTIPLRIGRNPELDCCVYISLYIQLYIIIEFFIDRPWGSGILIGTC